MARKSFLLIKLLTVTPSTRHFDMRAPMLGLVSLPLVLWVAAPVAWITNWPSGWGFLTAIALLVAGCNVASKNISWQYYLARGFLPAGFMPRPGDNYLFFEMENVDTVERLKLFADDMGCLFPEDGVLRMRTSKNDLRIPLGSLETSTYRLKGKAKGVLLSFKSPDSSEQQSGVASFKYFGKDLSIGADREKKATWAQDIIRTWQKKRLPSDPGDLDSPGTNRPLSPAMGDSANAATPFASAIYSACIQQAIIMILAAMILDGGCIGQVCLSALLAFWGGVLVLRVRTRGALTKTDLMLVRGGYILVCVISYFVTRWIWHLRGYDHYL
jgi:hypothetical protein